MNKRLALSALIGVAISLVSINSSSAQVSVSLRPVKYILEINAGDDYNDEIVVINNSPQTITLRADLQDFVPTGEASINFVPHAGPGTSLVDWFSIDRAPMVFAPNEEKRIPFTIKVPANAAPGSHLAAIFFNTEPGSGGVGSGVGITARVGSLVMVAVPGEITKTGRVEKFIGPTRVENGPLNFTIKYYNSGKVHYKPEGRVIIKNIFNKKVSEGTVDSQYVFAGTSRTMSATVSSGQYYWGPQTAVLEIKDGDGNIEVVKYQLHQNLVIN